MSTMPILEGYPISPEQRRAWVVQQSKRAELGASAVVMVEGRLDGGRFRSCVDWIAKQYEILRTDFQQLSGMTEPLQVISSDAEWQWSEKDLTGYSGQEQQEIVHRAAGMCVQQMRVELISLSDRSSAVVFCMPALVTDRMGLISLVRAVILCYLGGRQESSTQVQYADIAQSLNESLESPEFDTGRSYWMTQWSGKARQEALAKSLCVHDGRPFQKARERVQGIAGQSAAILRRCNEWNCTPQNFLLACWLTLALRHSEGWMPVIGFGGGGRDHEVIAEAPGLLVRYLPVWVDVNLQTPLREMVDKVAAATSEAVGWQQFFDWNQIESAGPIPILRWCFESCSMEESIGGDAIHFQIAGVWGISDGFAQRLVVQEWRKSEGHAELGAEIDYDAAGMRAQEAQWLAEELETVVEEALAKPEAAIGALPIIGRMQREMLRVWNQTKGEYARDKCVHELFEEQVERTPDAVAAAYGEEQVSYGHLNRHANRLAHYLISLGVKPDGRVAICVERGLEMVIGILGILKAGAAYVPLDPSYPAERLRFMVEDSSPVVVMTQESLRGMVEGIVDEMRVVELSGVMNRPGDREEERNPGGLGTTSQNLCYVIYTSGSTGTPKGVMVEHRALLNHMEWMQREFRYGPNDRILQRTPISFDASVWEFFAPLLCGGKLVLLRSEVHADVESLTAILKKERITVVQMVPMLLAALVEVGGIAAAEELRLVCCGGELLKTELVQRCLHQKHVEIVNLYAPTEATIDATYWRGIKVPFGAGIPIGRPILNTQLHVLDWWGDPVPMGVAGEIYIGGAGVARGYLRRPELTAERFVPDPYAEETGARMYRTGDLGRWLEAGNIEFVGRNDDQVKIRGYRIELGEIEARLAEHEQVREAVVVVREDGNGEKRLVAYVVAESEPDAGDLAGRLRAYLVGRLPEYMVPAAYVRLEQMPLTPNGKLDRKALPAPEGKGHAQSMYEAPRGEIEEKLASLWQELLGVEHVGRHDNFFELGGHSLLAVQLVEQLHRLSLQVDVRALFTTPVLSELATTLSHTLEVSIPPALIKPGSTVITPEMLPLIELTQQNVDQIVERVPGGIANIQDIYALAPLQEGILFHHLMAGDGDPYTLNTQMVFPDRVLLDGFLAAAQQVVDRHDILRTCFMWEGLSRPAQVVLRRAQIPVTEIELDSKAGPVGEQLARHFDPRRDRMDLTQAPLLHFAIAHDPEDDCWVLLMRLHHMIGDHSTLDVLRAEVRDFLAGHGDKLSPPQPFRNLIAQVRRGVSQEEHQRFFREMLGEITEPTLPFGLVDVNQDGKNIVEPRVMLSPELNDRLRTQARRLGVSLASLCHLAWGQVLARSSGNERVVFGTVLFGRMLASDAGNQAVGMFINTLPLRLDFDDTETEAAVHQVQMRLGELLMHEHASLALAQRCSGIAAPNPLFSAILNYRYARMTPREGIETVDPLADVTFESNERNNYPLTMSVEDYGQSLGLTALVVQPLAERICPYMQQALESLVDALENDPQMPVRQLEILPPRERQQLLVEWNATAVDFGAEACLHELFEGQVEQSRDSVALEYGSEVMTYGELDCRANQLGHYLRKLGVGPEARVGICIERSLEMVVGLLGILKAGGAYVPLDAQYPAERLGYMVEDSGSKVVVTQTSLVEKTKLGQSGARVVCVDQESGEIGAESEEWPVSGVRGENLAYIYYTSGSTGRPKGVAMGHAGIVNYIQWGVGGYEAEGGNGSAVHSSIAVDLTLSNFLPLFVGKKVVLAAEKPGVEGLVELMQGKPEWSMVKVTPTHLTLLNPRLTAEEMKHSTRVLVIGADNLVAEPTLAWREQAPEVKLLNEYGPTETVVGCSIYRIEEGAPRHGGMPIGKPISNMTMYVLDGEGEPVPIGVQGELYIGGIGVARGYWERADLTAEKFVPDPFAGKEGARFYRTGDRARILGDGNMEFLGRMDHQVKIRGYRVEPAEVEAVLSGCAGVQKAMVVVREDEPGEKRLVGYVAAPGGGVEGKELREYLRERLPEYMVPTAWVIMEELPVRGSGKIDPKDLPRPETVGDEKNYVAPRTEVEKKLAEIWEELLGARQIGIHDNFFELGGHSLLAVRLMLGVQQVFDVELPVASLFAQPTLAQLAEALSEALAGERREAVPSIMPVSREGALPLSFAQQRLWFLAQLEPESTNYNIPFALRLRGEVDRSALRRSLDELWARHESLRSIFVAVDGQPHVELLPAEKGLSLVEEDLRGVGDRRERVVELSREEAWGAFDLARGPLVRACLIQLEEQEYVFLLTQHHIVSDGWSMGIFEREIGELYRAFSQGGPNPLAPLTIQYPDYAAWQRQWLSGERLQKQIEYWRQTLADAPVLLELPTDRPRPMRQSFEGAGVTIRIDSELTQGLRELSNRCNTTLFMTLLGAWAAVLSRLSGQQDLVIGTPSANRGRLGTEGMIGFFVNTLVLRMELRNEPSVAELLGRVRATALAAQDHQDLPFEQVVEIMQPPRRLNHTPLFQVMFLWQNNELPSLELTGIAVEAAGTSFGTAKFDLELFLYEQGNNIVGALNYATALFDEATIERHSGYLITMLKAMVADSEQSVAGINLLAPEERTQLDTWNATKEEYPEHLCIHELFEQQVEKTPQATAVVYEEQWLSYIELNEQANRLAHYLINLGVKPDERVGICAERSLGMVIGLLGILKAGGAYVPLDPGYPAERLGQILVDAAPRITLSDGAGREALGTELLAGLTVVNLDQIGKEGEQAPEWGKQPDSNPDPQVLGLSSRHLAYVIYTSGSTGIPKGVMNEHHALVNRLLWMQRAYGLDATDVVLQKTSFSFDVSVWEFFWTLLQGAILAIAPPDAHKDSMQLIELVQRQAVTTMHFVPSMLAVFVNSEGVEGCTSLRRLVCSGEALAAAQVQAYQSKVPGSELNNLYGPTEAAIDVTAWSCPRNYTGMIVPIGKPIANTQIYILDAQQQPVPMGVAGELYIGGAGVARGYLRRPELTAERFVPDPFRSGEGGRMYKTGDLARYLQDGNIEFLGRNDQQVKIRGFRIELGEIEARLSQHALVREAVVEARGAGEEKRLAAYVIPADETIETGELVAALRAHLAKTLPDYMVPAAYVMMDAFPLTPNGKLDRKALPAPDDEAFARHSYEPPQGEVETVLAQLWSELLGIERIGRHDNFFELGGHSLLAVQLMERLRRAGLGVEIRTFFATPVLADLAVTLGSYREAAVPPNTITAQDTALTPDRLPLIDLTQGDIDRILAKVPGGLANVQDIYALAPLQEGILFHHLLTADGDPYLLTGQVAFPSRTALDQYLAALQQVIDRHDILRTAFVWEGLSSAAQVVWRQAPLSITELTLDPWNGPVREQLAQQFDPRSHRLDLTQAPLLRFFIAYDPENNRWLLLQSMHHLIGDHSTLDFLLAEVRAILAGQGHRLAAPQPFRHAVAQARLGIPEQDHERFFRSQLADIDEPTLPFGLSDVHRDGGQIIEVQRKLPQALNDRLRSQARRLGVSLASLCHLAWGQVLARSSGQEQVVFGTVLFGRMQAGEGADRAMGLFINTLPLRLDLEETGVEASVRQTHARLTDLLRHEHASLALAQRCSGVRAPAPLFSALLNYRHNSPPSATREDAQGSADDPLQGVVSLSMEERTNYPITLSVEDFGQALGLTAQVVSSISPERVCGYMQQALESLAHALETAPQIPVRQLEILPPEERRLQLETWNATAAEYPQNRCIHQLFEQQVERGPQATAVVFEGQSLSYAELSAEVNRVAHHLIALGVKPDDRVAICVERGAGMVMGLLGILKAGGAYVPLDPAYPPQRLREILADAEPKLLLSDAAGRAALGEAVLAERMVVDLNQTPPAWAGMPDTNPDAKALGLTSQHSAYVIYTSGSTGKPKGVIITHDCVVNFLISMSAAPGMTAQDRLLAVTSISFDIAGLELYLPLSRGAQVVIAGRSDSADPKALQSLLERHKISVMQATPATWRALLDSGWSGSADLKMLCGGEALSADLSVRLGDQGQSLWNMYGPTETTIWSSCMQVQTPDHQFSNQPIGRPIGNTRIYVLDGHGQPVPLGVIGEIYIGGVGVARGYLKRPELTAERFVPDSFSAVVGARMYRTGDLGRYLPDGNIEFLGRNDYQVKIRGYRIELGEIEARLVQHPGVREAAVIAREDVPGEKRLVGYVVPQPVDGIDTTNGISTKTTFSLFYFGADTSAKENKYELYLKSAKFADLNQFESIWTPERHFHNVGKLYPNPATLSAALSTMTTNVKLRAGSVVLPLHDPIRVAEEWAIVDNLSNGRAGIAAASGWHPRDFSFFPQNYARRRQAMMENIQLLKSLWRGEAITRTDGNGKESSVRIFPEPIQAELPLWITAAGSPDTFIQAGKLGANLLTHLLGQTIPELAEQIAQYRAARAEAGHDPQTGRVTLMIHTFVGEDLGETLNQAKAPFMDYMREHLGLMASWAKSLDVNVDDLLNGDKKEKVAEFAFERYSRTASLIGTPQSCLSVANQLQEIGVDEIACLIDWMDTEKALNGLPQLKQLYDLTRVSLNRATLRSHLSSQLPEYMLPAAFVVLDGLPRTPNGKLDRKSLPTPGDEACARRGYEAPQGEIEQKLAGLWRELLRVERVGQQDDFFELGGHSLTATRLLARIHQAFGVELSVATVFARSTLMTQAQAVAEASATAEAVVPMARISRDEPMPLSFAQQRLWFLAQLEGVSATYHVPLALRLRGALDRAALRRALDTVLARHEGLRSVFVAVDGQPQVHLLPETTGLPLIEHDLRGREDASVELARLSKEEARAPFDLAQGPLIRGRLVQLAEDDHMLLLTQHHIVSDGWSTGVLSHELSTLYRAFQQGQANPLPPLTIQYPDCAAWQRAWLSGERLERQIGYWREALTGAPALLELPTDRPRPAQPDYSGARVPIVLDAELTRSLKQLSQRHGTTLFMTALAAWAAVLSRLSGQDEVVIGTLTANRGRAETEGLIGLFVSTLALRIQLGESPSVSELLSRVRRVALAAQEHQDLPFEQVVEIVQPPRRLNHTPIFQVLLNWQNNEVSLPDFTGLQVSSPAAAYEVLRFDLELSLSELNEQIVGNLAYATALFDAATMELHVGYLQAALRAMVSGSEQRVAAIELLSDAERRLQLETWNATVAPYPQDRCIHQLFEEQVGKSPEAPAVVHEDRVLSYSELNAQANRLARHLIELGVRPDDRVAICVERSAAMVMGLLAILKAGGAYVPLDPAYPSGRLSQIVADAAPSLVLIDAAGRAALGEVLSSRQMLVDLEPLRQGEGSATAWSSQPVENPQVPGLTSRHLAYVIYTSGSTGRPKGVAIEHRNAANLLCWARKNFAAEETRHTLFSTSLQFDLSIYECFVPLIGGGTVHVVADALSLIQQPQPVSLVNTVPSAIATVLEHEGLPSSTCTVNLAGEPLKAALIRRLLEQSQVRRVCNLYGPTETTTYSTWISMERGGDVLESIGRPIANTKIYLLDEKQRPVPLGAVGEIYIGGAGVARGYLNRPELTAERFVRDPFTRAGEGRMYRTGDLGRYLADGNIEFLGRNDQQVKIRGFRIELGEIEARLAEHEWVREAVVVARENASGEKQLVAYVVAAEAMAGSETENLAGKLRAYLTGCLPEYMVPAAIVRLEALPLTPNGKLDRKALPQPEGDAYAVRGYEAPQGEIETQLAETWADLLHVERVGRHDDFFALGGHSLLAVRLMERMRRKGLQVDVRALFATPTLAGLASGIGGQETIVEVPANRIPAECAAITPEMLPLIDLKQEEIDQIVEQVPGGIANVQDIYALSPLQKGILFHHLMGGEGDPYLGAVRLSFESRTRLDTYVKAMRAVIERHDILRTAVVWEGLREPVQVVWREAVLPVEEVELDPGAGDVAEQLYARFNPRQYRIDVRQAPLLRAYIAEDEEKERWLMVLLLHHLAGDRVTMEVMQEEMEAHLLGRAEQLPAPLPFRNLVAQARLGVSPEEHQAFFRQLLGDVTEPTAAFGLLDVQGDGTGIEEARITLEPDVAGRVRESARKLGVSAASLCHLAWAQVLARVSGREDVVFGTVLFGRMQGGAGADRVLGPFINTLPVRIQIGDEGVEAGVRRVHSQLSDLLRHEHASLALAQRCSGVAAPTPLFSALLNYRHSSEAVRGVSEDRRRAWKGIGVLYGQDLTNYPVTLSVDDLGEGFVLTAQVAARIGSMRVCEYMHTALKSLVEALESTPGKAISGLDVLPEKERKQLLYEWNATGMEYPREKCIQELFEEQVERTPAATAVVSEEESVNYDELNRRANRLAHHLREIGVKADERVGVCAERGVDMVVALLATLKAGGAYVPLDPEYPDDRLQYMMKNASPAAVLTQPHLQERLKAFSGRDLPVIALSPAARWQEQSAANCEHDEGGVNPERLAYVIYTSGSTGTPKGVMIEHRSIVNRLIWMQNAYGLKTEDAVLQKTPFSFDVSVWEFFWPLLVGARLVMARPGWHKDPIYLSETIERNRITTLHFVPSMLQAFLELGDSRRCSSVKRIICSGEALSADVAWRCREVLPLADLHNLYGPTEATVDVTSWTYPASGEKATTIPIGRPIANTRVYILDKNMHPVPVGVVGELYIGGVQIARGYLNRQDLTAERFVKDPVASQPGARIYRTGDLARWLEDGNIEYLGRNDYQVKIRGFRIELGEIEARLSEHPQVREVVVVAREDGGGGKRLVAYVVVAESKVEEERVRHSLQEHREMEAGELSAMLHTYLAGQLPEYMVPATYVRLERMPLTPNGKLDRRALPEPERDAYARRGYEEPQGETESKLAKIWENLLGTPQVGRHDNFFELGGHSLLVMQLMVEVQRSFGINISLRDVFISPTLAELAAALKRGDLAIRHQNLIPIRPAGTETPLFIVHALGGGVDYVADLAPFIDVNIPIYGLQATGFAPGEEPLKTIEEMAELYVDGIRQVQPHGPYRVAGWSAGGTIAYAMARRLIELGGEVGFVGLLDTICYERTTMDSESGRPKDFDANFELIEVLLMIHLDKKDLDDVIQMAQIYDFETLIERGRHIMDKIAKKIPEVHTLDVSFLRRILKIRHATANALLNYSCVRLSMPVWLFEAKESVPPSGPAWRRLLGDDIQVVPVQGTHHTMTTGLENLSSLGAAITGALAKNSVQIVSFPSSHSLTLSAADI